MKKTIIGWIPNDATLKMLADLIKKETRRPRNKVEWRDSAWPPRKVKITIEEV